MTGAQQILETLAAAGTSSSRMLYSRMSKDFLSLIVTLERRRFAGDDLGVRIHVVATPDDVKGHVIGAFEGADRFEFAANEVIQIDLTQGEHDLVMEALEDA